MDCLCRNLNDKEHGNGKSRRHPSRISSDALRAASAKCVNESFEIVNYRDSIKTVDCDFLWRWTGIQYFAGCRLWCVKDCCGGFCVTLTWSLVMFAEFVICRILLVSSLDSLYIAVNGFTFQCLTFLAVVSHLKSMFTNPVGESVASN
jgi:hypothetical protein